MDLVCVSCLATDEGLNILEKPELDMFKYLLNNVVLHNWDGDIFKFCNGCKKQLLAMCEFQRKAHESFNTIQIHMRQKQSTSDESIGKIRVKEEFSYKEDVQHTEEKVHEMLDIKLEEVHQHPVLIIEPLNVKSTKTPKRKMKKRVTRRSHKLMKLRQQRKRAVNTNIIDDDDDDDDEVNQLDDDKIDSEATLSASETFDSDSEQVERKNKKRVTFVADPLKDTNIKPLFPITTRGQEREKQSWRNISLTDREVSLHREEDVKGLGYLKKPYKCVDCIVSFWEERLLANHLEKMHAESAGPFQCSICKSRYAEQKKMECCQMEHKTMYKCMKCTFSTRNFNHIKKHHAVEHSRVRYPCDECEGQFVTYNLLFKHKLRKHKFHFECKCGESFKTYSKLYLHRKTHLNQPESSTTLNKCHFCHKLYQSGDRLRAHVHNSHGHEPVYCAKCDTTFKSNHSYKAHFKYSRKHHADEELKYQCDKCEKRFQTVTQFNSHYKHIHLRQGEHQCELCPKKFAFKRSLKHHVARTHGNYVKVKDKICDVCGKAFEGMKILQSHMVTHTGERPYKCHLCPSTFGFKAALYTHNKLVHEKVKRVWPKKKKKQTNDNVA